MGNKRNRVAGGLTRRVSRKRRRLSFLLLIPAALLVALQSSLSAASVGLETASTTVGPYEKIEFTLRLDARYENPFDPTEVDLSLLITSPSGRPIVVPAYFAQDYQRRQLDRAGRMVDWMYPAGEPGWKARFAPAERGDYSAVARLKDRRGTFLSSAVRFQCVAPPSVSPRHGFLRVSRDDPRFLELSDGTPFFAIGQNLAFVGDSQYASLTKAEQMFAKLAENGANYLRVWTCCEDWALAIEARKSAWGRSWDKRSPLETPPNAQGRSVVKAAKLAGGEGATLAVAPSHAVALRPETKYVVTARYAAEGGAKLAVEVNGTRLGGTLGKSAGTLAPSPPTPLPQGERGEVKASPLKELEKEEGFRGEFTTGKEQWWLDRMALRLESAGSIWITSLSLREAAGGPELLWEADVRRTGVGIYNPLDCFMLDEVVRAAESKGLYLQLCLMTRDLYMGSLKDPARAEYQTAIDNARKLLRYAVARWGYSTSVAAWEYFNEIDPGLPTDRFYDEVGRYLEEIDPYRHLRTTSTWGPSPKDCRHGRLDVAEVHYYLRPADRGRIHDEVEAVLERSAWLRHEAPARPALLGEFGLADDQWREHALMRSDKESVHFHNALWASALSGTSGTALFWWWDELDRKDAYHHYGPLAGFLAGIPFAQARLKAATATLSAPDVRLVGLQGESSAYLWLFDPAAAWTRQAEQKSTPEAIRGVTLKLTGLQPRKYRVEWWNTREGKVLERQAMAADGGAISLAAPSFVGDVACKVIPATP